MEQYITLQAIYHSGEGRPYEAGEMVNLDHLPQATIKALVQRGVVAPAGDLVQAVSPQQARLLILEGIGSLQALIEANAVNLEERTAMFRVKQIREWQAKAQRIIAPSGKQINKSANQRISEGD